MFFRLGGLLPGDPGGPAQNPRAQVERVPEQFDELCPAEVGGGGVTLVRCQRDDDDAEAVAERGDASGRRPTSTVNSALPKSGEIPGVPAIVSIVIIGIVIIGPNS